MSKTGATVVDVSPDGNSIIFQSVETDHQVYWPVTDYIDLREYIQLKINRLPKLAAQHDSPDPGGLAAMNRRQV